MFVLIAVGPVVELIETYSFITPAQLISVAYTGCHGVRLARVGMISDCCHVFVIPCVSLINVGPITCHVTYNITRLHMI